MSASRDTALLTAVTLGVVGVVLGTALAPVVATDVAQQSQPETDNTVTRIEVSETGTARWTIQIRTRLDTDERVEEYTAFQTRFRNDTEQYLGGFRTRMRGVVAGAANVTGREMRATNFTASTSIQEVPRRWGVVTYEFTWTNFAAQQSDRLVVSDVFEGGFFIAANDTLQVVSPAGYEITRTDPAPASRDDGRVTWSGREDFADGRPRIVFVPATGQSQDAEREPGTSGDGAPFDAVGVAVLGLLGVGVLAVVAIVVYRRTSDRAGAADATGASAGDRASTSSDPPPDSEDATPTSPVLTDEERVVELLEANGGRLRQAAIAEEFDWSASKTSRLVGTLADEGVVEKLQLGRENLVALVDEDE